MIFICVKFEVKADYADQWPELSREFTEATRNEPGNKWFDWSRSVDHPNEYILIEAFEDDAAEAHVKSDHFQKMRGEFPQYLASTPKIISRQIDGDGWDTMGEIEVD